MTKLLTHLFDLKAVDVTFGQVDALRACNLSIAAGERVALIGSNGSGKSTLLRVLHGLVQPTSGVRAVDTSITQAMLFQHPYM